MARRKRTYDTIQDWMEATGTNTTELARLIGCKKSHMSLVLRKSRRCSLDLALRLSKVTGVSIETIAEWPSEYRKSA